jgi:hypothetical protein
MLGDARSFDGIDVAWLASDSVGHVAAFITGGAGPIPAAALGSLEYAESQALALPDLGALHLHVQVPHSDSFVALAKKGVFVYDWPDPGTERGAAGAYQLAASPACPLRLVSAYLPACVVHFPDSVFGAQEFGVVA